MKIISIVCGVAVGAIVIACANLYDSTSNGEHVTSQTTVKWKTKAPELFSNAGYSRLIEVTKTDAKISKSQAELIGKITNPFGIRDDILDYILTSIPENNVRSRIAIIKMVYYDQQMIGVTEDKHINQLANKSMAAVYCTDLPMLDRAQFGRGYDKLLRNTPARQAEQDRIERLLSGHIILADFGIDTYDYTKQCNYFLGFDK